MTIAPLPQSLVAALSGDVVAWRDVGLSCADVLQLCAAHEVTGLLHEQLRRPGHAVDWPAELIGELARLARADAAIEIVRRAELAAALAALAAASVHPILLKGTPLAYTVYDTPSARPRCDTDLLLPRAEIDRAKSVLATAGYTPTVYCDGELLFRQFELLKIDALGVQHVLDVHWAVSTQTVFADVLSYDELAARAVPVPALGPDARTAAPADALLLACIHPVMHHRNEQRVLWTYDIHRLASRLTAEQWSALAERAIARKVAAIVAHSLARAQQDWRTRMPGGVRSTLTAVRGEASARYLDEGRRWHHELVANVAHLPSWRARVRLLREVLFPSAAYMARAYGLRGSASAVLLPALYVHRLATGVAKLATGVK